MNLVCIVQYFNFVPVLIAVNLFGVLYKDCSYFRYFVNNQLAICALFYSSSGSSSPQAPSLLTEGRGLPDFFSPISKQPFFSQPCLNPLFPLYQNSFPCLRSLFLVPNPFFQSQTSFTYPRSLFPVSDPFNVSQIPFPCLRSLFPFSDPLSLSQIPISLS